MLIISLDSRERWNIELDKVSEFNRLPVNDICFKHIIFCLKALVGDKTESSYGIFSLPPKSDKLKIINPDMLCRENPGINCLYISYQVFHKGLTNLNYNNNQGGSNRYEVPIKEIDPYKRGEIKMNGKQSIYLVNCRHCGHLMEVVNPDLSKEPIRILVDNESSYRSNTSVVSTRCTNCSGNNPHRQPQHVRFYYY